MALSYNGIAGPTRGIETDETGVVMQSFSVRYYLAVNDFLENKDGERVKRAFSAKFSREVSIGAVVSGSTGIMAIVPTTAATIANDTSTFGDGSGGLYLMEVTEHEGKGDWRNIDMTLQSEPGLT